jgi:hypothetical protein
MEGRIHTANMSAHEAAASCGGLLKGSSHTVKVFRAQYTGLQENHNITVSMAEVLGAISGALSLLDVCARTSWKLFDLIENWKDAPKLIEDLASETMDLAVVLARVRGAADAVATTNFGSSLETQLQKSTKLLADLELLVKRLERKKILSRTGWLFKKSKALSLQSQIRESREKMAEIILACNMYAAVLFISLKTFWKGDCLEISNLPYI